MKKTFVILTLVLCYFIYPKDGFAVTLPWATSYDCNEWNSSGGALSCSGLITYGTWKCDGSYAEQITSPANNPAGSGRGQRHWKGDGHNNNSGGLRIPFSSPQPELWVRWYMRYQQGFKWSSLSYDKILYIQTESSGVDAIPEWYGSDGFRIYAQSAGGTYKCASCGWNTTMGGTASDGKWHYHEIHIKMDTNGSNGIAEAWIDGRQIMAHTNVNFGTRAGWTSILVGSNQDAPLNGGCNAVDFDDIAVSSTGRIGPLTAPAGTVKTPSVPQPLSVK